METKQLSYAELVKLAHEATPAFLDLAKSFVTAKTKLDKNRDEFADGVQYNGAIMCVLKRDWENARTNKTVMVSKSFPEHYENLMGMKPHNKAQSCANAFDAFVLAPETITIKAKEMKDGVEIEVDKVVPNPIHIAETDYYNCPAEAVQQASRVVSRVKDNLAHPAVAEAAGILRVRPKKAIANLKRLCERIQEVETTVDGKVVIEIKFLTEEELDKQQANPGQVEVAEIAGQLSSSPTGLGAMIAALLATAQATDKPEMAQAMCHLNVKLPDALAANVDKDGKRRFETKQLMAWGREVANQAPAIRTEEEVRMEAQQAVALIGALTEKLGGREKLQAWLESGAENTAPVIPPAPAAEVKPEEVTTPAPEMAPAA